MFKKVLLALGLLVGLAYGLAPADHIAWAQNTTCSDRPQGDVSNACANTRFVFNNSGGSVNCIVFTSLAKGCVPASGGGTINFLRADGTFAPTAGGGSAIVGMIIPWAGASVPPTYQLAYGQLLSRTTFVDLYSVLTATQTVTCTGGNPTITVTADNAARMTIGGHIESPCFIAGTTVVSKTATTLTMINNALGNTTATITLFPWGNGDGSTTFNVPNLMGRSIVGRDNMSGSTAGVLTSTFYGANPDALGASGGAQSTTLVAGNLPPYTPSGSVSGSVSITDPGHTHTTNANSENTATTTGGGAFSLPSAQPASISPAFTGITASMSAAFTGSAQGGSSTPFSQIQPSVTIDWIIKVLPDSAVGDTITVGVTNVAGGSSTNILFNNAGKVGEYTLSTANQYNCATAGSLVQPSVVYQAETVTAYAATINFDFCTFKNTAVTLTGDITTMTVSNVVAGKAGMITYIQDGPGGHTTVFDPVFKFTGGVTPTLTATGGAVDILTYACRSATFCGASLLTDVR